MQPSRFDEVLEQILVSRGISMEDMEDFVDPDYLKLHDPMLLPDIERARDRVIEAINNREKIMIFSDYDADGIPGAVVMSDFFQRIKYDKVSFYIPHRHDEGFGLNMQAVDQASLEGVKLMITVDCGVSDIEEVKHANDKSIDVIITDHHEPQDNLPQAFAIVDPKLGRGNEGYPFKELCGAALAYKLVQAILAKENFGLKSGMEKWSLDMVGIATLSDMVPLVGENRILAKYGLEVLKKTPRPGLAALFKKLKINQKYITEDDIAFMITPRINAASRMGTPEDAFKLLSTKDMIEAEKLALHLEKINNERKGIVASIVKDAKAHLAKREERENAPRVVVVGNPDWRPSLLGLVANSLVEEYGCPAFVWGRDGDGVLKGSCRSYGGINLYDLMNKTKDSFIEYGGHSGAGGFSLALEHISNLEDELSKSLEHVEAGPIQEEGNIMVSLSEVGPKLWDTVSKFAPFGTGNPKPVFQFSDAEIKSAKNFGKSENHLEIIFKTDRGAVKAISFFNTIEGTKAPLMPGAKVSLKAHLEKSYFMNRPELRLRIVDII
jgi:single-stranded-DNA-specific exonuclease